MKRKNTAPNCLDCSFGFTKRCGGYQTTSPSAVRLENAGKLPGVGCFGEEKPALILDLYGKPQQESHLRPAPVLPVFIPQITTAGLDSIPPYPPDLDMFAVSLTTLFTPHGKLRWRDGACLKRALRLPPDSHLILVGSCSDLLLEKIWRRAARDRLWESLARVDFDAATGFSFSVWDDQARFDQIINQRRNEISCRNLAKYGLRTIPIIFWYEQFDYRAALHHIRQWTGRKTVCIHAQFIRKGRRFEKLWADMVRLEGDVGRKLRYLIIGISDATRMRRLIRRFNCSFVTAAPFAIATRAGCLVKSNLVRERSPNWRYPREELVALNMKSYLAFCTSQLHSDPVRSFIGLRADPNPPQTVTLEASEL